MAASPSSGLALPRQLRGSRSRYALAAAPPRSVPGEEKSQSISSFDLAKSFFEMAKYCTFKQYSGAINAMQAR